MGTGGRNAQQEIILTCTFSHTPVVVLFQKYLFTMLLMLFTVAPE